MKNSCNRREMLINSAMILGGLIVGGKAIAQVGAPGTPGQTTIPGQRPPPTQPIDPNQSTIHPNKVNPNQNQQGRPGVPPSYYGVGYYSGGSYSSY